MERVRGGRSALVQCGQVLCFAYTYSIIYSEYLILLAISVQRAALDRILLYRYIHI